MRRFFMAGMLAMASPASAQWMHEEQGGAFEDDPLQIAVTMSGYYGFGFRCETAGDLEILFMTPEEIDSTTARTLNSMNSKLLIRIDDNEPHTLSTRIEPRGNDNELAAISYAPFDVLREVNAANRRVVAALEVVGEVYHETDFNVRGSTKASQRLANGCGIDLSPPE